MQKELSRYVLRPHATFVLLAHGLLSKTIIASRGPAESGGIHAPKSSCPRPMCNLEVNSYRRHPIRKEQPQASVTYHRATCAPSMTPLGWPLRHSCPRGYINPSRPRQERDINARRLPQRPQDPPSSATLTSSIFTRLYIYP